MGSGLMDVLDLLFHLHSREGRRLRDCWGRTELAAWPSCHQRWHPPLDLVLACALGGRQEAPQEGTGAPW